MYKTKESIYKADEQLCNTNTIEIAGQIHIGIDTARKTIKHMSKIEGIYRMAEGKKIHKVSYNYRPVVLFWIIETNNSSCRQAEIEAAQL